MKAMNALRLRQNDVVKKKTLLGMKYYLVIDPQKNKVRLAEIKSAQGFTRNELRSDKWKKSSMIEAVVALR